MPDDPALARGVHRLQDEEHGRAGLLVVVGCEQAFLQVIEVRCGRGEVLLACLLVTVVSGGRLRVDVAEAEAFADAQEGCGVLGPVAAHALIFAGGPGRVHMSTREFSPSRPRSPTLEIPGTLAIPPHLGDTPQL